MYKNDILNFQESTTILNACTKKSGNLLNVPRILEYFFSINVCVSGFFFIHNTRIYTFTYTLNLLFQGYGFSILLAGIMEWK